MTEERGTPVRKRRAPRKGSESEVDRAALARIVSDRLKELKLEGVTQEKAAQLCECSTSMLRNMKNGTGDSHYGHESLTKVAKGLVLPDDQVLVKAFYRRVPRDPAPPSDEEMPETAMTQRQWDQLAPYLAKLDTIATLQDEMARMHQRLKGVADDVRAIRSRLDHPLG